MNKIPAGFKALMVLMLIVLASCSSASTTPAATPPPSAAKLVFTKQPAGATAGSALTAQPVISVTDANGNTVTSPTFLVVLSVTSGTGASGAVLLGATTVNTVNGVVAFRDLSINVAGSGYTLTATSRGLTSAASERLDITPGAAAMLDFTRQPLGAAAGSAFTTQPVVTVEDAYGNMVTSSTVPVTVSIASGAGASGAVLSGVRTVNAVNGVAAFKDLSIDLAEAGYALTATSGGLAVATSNRFNITPGAPAKLAFYTQPAGAKAGSAFTTQPEILVMDTYGNLVTGSEAPVTLAVTSGTGARGAVFSGSETVKVAGGVASFTDLSINLSGTGYTLTATSGNLTSAVSNAFDVKP